MTKHLKFSILLFITVFIVLYALQFFIPEGFVLLMVRILIFAAFANGYNLTFGYTGMLSLGHAMFFAAGLYGAGLSLYYGHVSLPVSLLCGILSGTVLAFIVGLVALRTKGVAFMIVTLMLSQAFFLSLFYYSGWTGGEDGLNMPSAARSFELFGLSFSLGDSFVRYHLALAVFALSFIILALCVRSSLGRILVAIRENENRTTMLGYNVYGLKLLSLTVSGMICAMAGASYTIIFGWVGASFASIQYSIEVLLYTLLGGAGTLIGPFVGTFVMQIVTYLTSSISGLYLIITGVILIVSILFFPKGIVGSLLSQRHRRNKTSKKAAP